MESITENGFYSLVPVLPFTSLLRIFLLLPVLVVLLIWYWNRSKKIRLLERLPSSKIRTLNFLGHMALLKYKYFFQYPAPLHAYHSILMSGFSQVYGKDGIFLVWQILHPAVIVYKAESVEMILNHSTEIKKAWFYRYLHPWLGAGLLTSDGSKWKQRRKLLTPAFHFNILKDFLPVMNKQSKVLVEILENQTSSEYTELVPLITKCSFDIICDSLFSNFASSDVDMSCIISNTVALPYTNIHFVEYLEIYLTDSSGISGLKRTETILGEEMHSQTLKYCDYLNSVSIITEVFTERILKPWLWSDLIFHISTSGWKFRHHVGKVKKFSKELISKKRKEKLELKSRENAETVETSDKDDIYHSRKRRALLDLLLDETIDNNSISEEEIRQEVDTFTFEGHDTTAMAMSWSLYLIGHHPDIQAKVHAELDSIFGDDDREPTVDDLRDMKYLECVFKETLRLYPSVPGYGRHLQQDINFKGHFIPKGSTCFVWAYLLHRDPEIFPNPEKFDPDRFKPENSLERHPFAYVPFSAGLRNCIGQKFAMMEEKCVLSAILRKYTIKSLQPRDQVHDIFEVVLRPYGGLKIQIKERNR